MITDGSRTLLISPLQDYSLELSLSNNNKSTIVHLAILYVVNRWDASTQICRSSSSISIGWSSSSIGGSSIPIGWGTYCMNIGLSWYLDIHIWLSSNFFMNIRLSSNLFINIWLSRNLNINIGLSQGVQVAVSYRGIICSRRSISSSRSVCSISSSSIRGGCIIRSSSSAGNQTGK